MVSGAAAGVELVVITTGMTVEVMMVDEAGQLLTVGAQLVMVISLVMEMVMVPSVGLV